MIMINRIQKIYDQLNVLFEKQFGWFFTNGRKADGDTDWMNGLQV